MKTNILSTLALATILFASCSSDDPIIKDDPEGNDNEERVAAQFISQKGGVNGDEWTQNDPIGIYMVQNNTIIISEGVENVQYNATTLSNSNKTASFTPKEPEQTINYPKGGIVDFIAYYPYSSSVNNFIYSVNASDQTNPANIDIQYAETKSTESGGYYINSGAVNLPFKHVMSKISYTLKGSLGSPDLTGIKLEIGGLNTTADFNLATGLFSNEGNVATIEGNTASNSAIVIPQTVSVGKLIVTLADNTNKFEYSLPNTTQFQSGKKHNYTITVNTTGISVAIGEITDWTGERGGDVDPEEELPTMVLISGGTFTMGSPTTEANRFPNETQYEVTLTKDFYMSKYQITNAQYAAFLNAEDIGSDGKWASGNYPLETLIKASAMGVQHDGSKWLSASDLENHPIINVTWYGADEYARWIGGSLPTEAQWEYACRAGTTTAYSFGADATNIGDYAWYAVNSNGTTHEVGTKQPNSWGLHDMHGNAWEWCGDWFGTYPSGTVNDPTGAVSGTVRVVRGGTWGSSIVGCRSAYRTNNTPDFASNGFGFRVVAHAP